MRILTIGTGSKGNCYVLEKDGERLIVECGSFQYDRLKRALGYDFTSVKGAIISHCHKDHAGDVRELLKRCINVAAPKDTFKGLNRYAVYIHIAEPLKGLKFGNFKVIPMSMLHDVECFGYWVDNGGESLFFATDTMDIPYNIPPTDCLMIEANYSRKIIDEKMFDGTIHKALHDRIIRSHLSFETARFFISQQKNLKCIILIHLSENNAVENIFEKIIQEDTGVPTYIAKPDLIVEYA